MEEEKRQKRRGKWRRKVEGGIEARKFIIPIQIQWQSGT